MKKNYITPMAKVIDVDTESLICVSLQDGTAQGEGLGKARDFFEGDDDEEDLW